nr:NADPH-dependent FMN reductase [uncultured Gellertiella sp.]
MNHMLAETPASIGPIQSRRQTRALLISGSITPKSHTRWLVDVAADELKTLGCLSTVLDLAEAPLPLATCDTTQEIRSPVHIARISRFLDAATTADIVILATPVYHGSYSGALKNAIDHLGKGAFSRKVVGLVSHGSAAITSGQPLEHLRPIAANLQGHPLPTQIATCDADFRRHPDGSLADKDGLVLQRIRRMATELASLSQALKLVETI